MACVSLAASVFLTASVSPQISDLQEEPRIREKMASSFVEKLEWRSIGRARREPPILSERSILA